MEPKSTLVRAECRIELHAETAIDLDLPLIVNPRNPEDNLTLRFADTLDQRISQIARVFRHDEAKALKHFTCGLVKLRFGRVALQDLGQNWFKFLVDGRHGDIPFIINNKA
ncbi:hypothetical protein D3C80_1366710 [compost metagenome]